MANAQTAAAASGRLLDLPRCLQTHEGFADAVAALRIGEGATFDGVWGSGSALLAAALSQHAAGCIVAVCPSQNDLDHFVDDLELFVPFDLLKFPAWESEPGERIVHDDIYGERLRLLKRLSSLAAQKSAVKGSDAKVIGQELMDGSLAPDADTLGAGAQVQLIATCIQSLVQAVPPPQSVRDNTRFLSVGSVVNVQQLLSWLVEHGFHHTSSVELPGEFAARGGILDIFAPDWLKPVRIELFDNEVESIRQFDVLSQRSLATLADVDVTALSPSGQERDHFSAYLPPSSWIVLFDPDQIRDKGSQFLRRLSRPQDCHSVDAVMAQLQRFSLATATGLAQGSLGATCRLQIESVERFSGDFAAVRSELDKHGEGNEVYIVAQTEAEVERLEEILSATRLASGGNLNYVVGCLHHGFRLVRQRIVLISGDELFHRGELRRTVRRRLGKAIDSFLDLREGDLVVHLAHGIGRYRGLKLLAKEEHVEEHLVVEFHSHTKIYVPVSKIDLVQKYVGGTKSRPTLARIGGASWLRQKKAAEVAVTDLAAEMLQLQAARASQPGIAFSQDTPWQREFDASFPYQETPDQQSSWDAIKEDMQRPRPMDRLLCGDVGFGKTEVAMRAAFLAVESGYQVALLAPTTILVEQHYRTFCERMAEFPFDIAKLSRFCTGKQQRDIVEQLGLGRIDIVIGTHRLASSDVSFFNLGLVIIDEEQRFGVEVKERLKSLRSTVDVLTMSATPIPRTLHMSLVGVRDICNLETPPEDRIAIETRVTRFDRELIRHAVLRELSRDGQVYFVHNRVEDIHAIAQKLRQIVPEARIRIGHGQMTESELEQVMVDFITHKFDILLATTIVESGLDIPNANTIFIDEADRYGLAELHQLRGRVGRYKHRAYSYLLVDPHKHITPNAAKRLRAIEEFSDMGAGFAIAMRDLEIRGAGNLLGTQQSGHIAAVGYEFYCQLLENAVRRLKKMPPAQAIELDMDLPGEAYLPDEYIADMRQKIDLYRRLSRIVRSDQLQDFRDELVDRFGSPPGPVQWMLALAELKLLAVAWKIQAIHIEMGYLVLSYAECDRIHQLAKLCRGALRVVDDKSAYLKLPKGVKGPADIFLVAKSVLSLR